MLFNEAVVVVGHVEVVSITSLITQRENDDGRIVLITLIHVHRTIHVFWQPIRVVAQGTSLVQVITHSVTFDVSLIVNIDTILVTQFIKTMVLWIVTKADCPVSGLCS